MPAKRREFLFFLIGDIRQNQAVDADFRAGGDKRLRPVGKDHIGVGHENHGDRDGFPETAHHIEYLVGGNPSGQRPNVGRLNDGPLRRGVGKRNAQLNQIRPAVRHCFHQLLRGLQIRVTAGEKRDERLALFKGFC
ncbi:hypothetical protein SDC9_78589 [bioreactor metagenome]|uniref:Uncharacterized protein n=1 Tax=bioreactor metagenome TaxID=1076179 RepID=A0A644YW09_9ZZZZ